MAIECYKRVPRLSEEDLVNIQFFRPDHAPVACDQTLMVRYLNGCKMRPDEVERCSFTARFATQADWAAVAEGLKVCSGENCNLRLGATSPKFAEGSIDQDEELLGYVSAKADHNAEPDELFRK